MEVLQDIQQFYHLTNGTKLQVLSCIGHCECSTCTSYTACI